ncbi:hypothetical protein ONS96_005660 [Cadophora gregata f. sp. sojae]|nr:hypothetical protein ONS96_005660 [Cadophora gregata f. sp. sojae]
MRVGGLVVGSKYDLVDCFWECWLDLRTNIAVPFQQDRPFFCYRKWSRDSSEFVLVDQLSCFGRDLRPTYSDRPVAGYDQLLFSTPNEKPQMRRTGPTLASFFRNVRLYLIVDHNTPDYLAKCKQHYCITCSTIL